MKEETKNIDWKNLKYLNGISNTHSSESLEGALPQDQNLPQKLPYGLLPEQINGTTFTTPRSENKFTWMYRILPSNRFQDFKKIDKRLLRSDFSDKDECSVDPSVHMFKPLDAPTEPTDFVQGIITYGGLNSPSNMASGYAIHGYSFNKSMKNKCFVNADGDFAIIPELGSLLVQTELGLLRVEPSEILVIPQGLKFRIDIEVEGTHTRGMIGETFHSHWTLPSLGAFGVNGLANGRHFQVPTSYYEDLEVEYEIIHKSDGELFSQTVDRSPFDVVAWYGTYFPMKYDVKLFNCFTTANWDHQDPSSHTVITTPSTIPGVAIFDLIAFVPRWTVSEHTFRSVYPHRNSATEFNFVVSDSGPVFKKGSSFTSPFLTPHGIPESSIEHSISDNLKPEKSTDLWLMLESGLPFRETKWALSPENRNVDYQNRFKDIKKRFNPNQK
eukprot:TRINITY_DN5315_c0_g1_i1.p1 TRINITY_DN5315_c0_g1~~TRINITY_DN5315_c0_g1_i1.p1  ORF type:complete len:442 (-),score=117.28 TRINITY_DN5315_c0_g1_i1:84-1409(-)